jgi:hypothetical protein
LSKLISKSCVAQALGKRDFETIQRVTKNIDIKEFFEQSFFKKVDKKNYFFFLVSANGCLKFGERNLQKYRP